jgi:hypothetical protein
MPPNGGAVNAETRDWREGLGYGIQRHTPEMRKVTAFLPGELLDAAMAVTGEGLTETLRTALRSLNHHAASQRLLAARGKVMFESDWRALRGKDEE